VRFLDSRKSNQPPWVVYGSSHEAYNTEARQALALFPELYQKLGEIWTAFYETPRDNLISIDRMADGSALNQLRDQVAFMNSRRDLPGLSLSIDKDAADSNKLGTFGEDRVHMNKSISDPDLAEVITAQLRGNCVDIDLSRGLGGWNAQIMRYMNLHKMLESAFNNLNPNYGFIQWHLPDDVMWRTHAGIDIANEILPQLNAQNINYLFLPHYTTQMIPAHIHGYSLLCVQRTHPEQFLQLTTES
jgi:hypothetical protein